MSTWKNAYESLDELQDYNDNALGLFALGLKFGLDDLVSIGADAITDGSDDKKLDMVYINPEDEYAVIGQCYFSTKNKESAPSNKASDLNTGLAWLLQRNITEIPDRIKSAAINLRQKIRDGEIKKINIWYVHNLPESQHVENELITVQQTAKTIVSTDFSGTTIEIAYKEVGNNTLNEWYEDCKTPILINETIEFPCLEGYEIQSQDWSAYSTAINAIDLYRLYKKNKEKIFSANVRDYLGSRSSDSNINHGIKKTIENEHNNFWAYNNGLTILTHGFRYSKNLITLNGISIVNGAQTTGAIGSLKKLPNKNAKVQARFIAVNGDNNSLIEDIIRYNNSQNKVEAADFRSTDRVQKRLKDEFNSIPDAEYEGGRRGSTSDAIRRRPNLLSSYSVGQALAAFHGEPIVAYNKKAGIWVNNKTYDKLFNDHTKAAHIVACYSLVRAIEDKKKNLQNKSNLTLSETNVLNFLRQRGAIFLTTHAISSCLEHILGRSVPNLFRISFGNKCSPSNAINNWKIILDILMPLVVHLKPAIENGMKNSTEIDNAVNIFSSLVGTITDVNSEKFDEFKSKITAP